MLVGALLLVSPPVSAMRRPLLQAFRGLDQWRSRTFRLQYRSPNMSTTKPKDQSKAAIVIALLNRAEGASNDEICQATKLQKHSTRAFLTGLCKKGLIIIREQRRDEGTVYRVAETPNEKPQQAAS